MYLALLFLFLKGINKIFERSNQEGRTNNDTKILNILKTFTIISFVTVFIFKFFLMYSQCKIGIMVKILFIGLFILINCIVGYCLCSSDISKINNFSDLFFVNEVNSENIPYKIYKKVQIITIILILLIITEFVSVELGINFTKLFTS